MNGHTPVVEQLIAAGAALDIQNNEGYGPCADCDDLTLFQTGSRLLGRNAAVNLAALTALILTALKGQSLMTEQLNAAGADLNVKFNEG
jgi:hypothetical protein